VAAVERLLMLEMQACRSHTCVADRVNARIEVLNVADSSAVVVLNVDAITKGVERKASDANVSHGGAVLSICRDLVNWGRDGSVA